MEETNLEPKRRPLWPWIVGLLVLMLLIWLLLEAMDRDEEALVATGTAVTETIAPVPTATTDTADAGVLPQQVEEYMRTCYLEEGAEPEAVGREHEFSTHCLNLLAGSMSAVAQQRPADPAIDQQIENVRQQAEAIGESDPTSLEHSNAVRSAAEASAEALGAMQQAFAGTDQQAVSSVDRAREAAQQISPTEALLDQKDALRTFFREAGNALRNMAITGSEPV
ncbi:MAG: hypothetical protein KY432_00160 [Acidobacteria bacterium]|nr:hypothetical protein [Acidobacteriota bacterium]